MGRYRSISLERIRQVKLVLLDAEAGSVDEVSLAEIRRDLHSLKGDSRLIGEVDISHAVHAAEDVLLKAGKVPGPEEAQLICDVLEVVATYIGAVGDPETRERDLEAAKNLQVGKNAVGEGATPAASEAGPTTAAGESKVATAVAAAPSESVPDTVTEVSSSKKKKKKGANGASRGARSATTPGDADDAGAATSEGAGEVVARPEGSVDEGPERDRWVQVNTQRIDDICEQLSDFSTEFGALWTVFQRLDDDGNAQDRRTMAEHFSRCHALLDDVTTAAWALRLVPVQGALEELANHARELAAAQGKKIRPVVRTGRAEVERRVLDQLADPLLHLVRNAVDHGIETPDERGKKGALGHLTLRAAPSGSEVVISIVDDGRGIDADRVRDAAVERQVISRHAADALDDREVLDLLFAHGFSTKKEVGDVSGRGIGLDVVRSRATSLGGSVSIDSDPGRGTRIVVTVPATISRDRVVVLGSAGALYGLPARDLVEVVSLKRSDVEHVAGGDVVSVRGEQIPLRSMTEAMGIGGQAEEPIALVVRSGQRQFALSVSSLVGEFDLLRRPVDPLLRQFPYVSGSSTLSDGRLVIMLLVAELVRRGDRLAGRMPMSRAQVRRFRVLVVDDSAVSRDLVSQILTHSGILVETACDGAEAMGIIEKREPELVLSDVEMPVMDGFELLERIRTRTQHLPVVMLTTRGSAEDRRRAANLGANAYLVKSQFEESVLLDTVKRFMS